LHATKFDGADHWIQQVSVESDDGEMLVAGCRSGTPISTSRGEFRSPYESQAYFWRDRWYNVIHLSRPGGETVLWYCNVTTPMKLQDGQITYIDLDLDVTVRPGGCIELLDSDEFEEHRLKYQYPAEVVDRAREAAGEVASLAQRREFPFDCE
jgi:protein associated with RNAse G/E